MKKGMPVLLTAFLLLAVCAAGSVMAGRLAAAPSARAEEGQKPGYKQITQEEAKEMMKEDDGHIVVDVRRQDEYDGGHIPGAILIPNESIGCDSPEALPDYDQIILIYCRSGNRSKQAAQKLAGMGYTNIFEFGGIIDWTGDIVTTEEENASAGLSIEEIRDFYYTYDASSYPPVYQRYRFYEEDGEYFFFHETREGEDWPQTEESITASGTVKLTEEDWKTFFGYIADGTLKQPEDEALSGDAGPWMYLYRGKGQEEYVFASYAARLAFEEYCRKLSGEEKIPKNQDVAR